MASGWEDYVEHLRLQMAKFVSRPFNRYLKDLAQRHQEQKAHFSRVGREDKFGTSDYSVAFSDCQTLQLLQRKIRYTSSALEANLDALKGCEDLCQILPHECVSLTLAEVNMHSRQIRFHLGSVNKLIEQSKATMNLVSPRVRF